MKHEKSCGAILFRVIDNEIQYLLLKSFGLSSFWGFAKGHMEGLETEEQTCTREVLEETGIKIQIENGFRVVDKYKITEDAEKEIVIFLGNAKECLVKIQKEEVLDYKWCNYDSSYKLLTYKNSKSILDKGNKFLLESSYILS